MDTGYLNIFAKIILKNQYILPYLQSPPIIKRLKLWEMLLNMIQWRIGFGMLLAVVIFRHRLQLFRYGAEFRLAHSSRRTLRSRAERAVAIAYIGNFYINT